VAKDDMDIVSALRIALAGKVGQNRFDLWFGTGTRIEYNGVALRIGAPSRFFLDWIRSNFRKHIELACNDILGACPSVEFYLDADRAETPVSAGGEVRPNQEAAGSARNESARAADSHRLKLPKPTLLPIPTSKPLPSLSPESNEVRSRRRFATLDSFVCGETNRLAVASAQMVVRQPGQLSPLIFHGPTSVGKTHLLEGIWSATRQSNQRLTAVYLSAEQFTSYFLEALRGSGLPNFRRKYRSVGILIIDDLQFFVGKRATQVELLHTIDSFLREGRQLVFAADRAPAELAELGPELTTRLTGGMVCRVETPDHATRLGIVAQMAKRMSIDAPIDVQQYVASRLTNHARELSGALCRLQATSQALGRPITLSMAEEALADLVRHSARAVRLPDIEKAVCHVFGMDPASLQSSDKGKKVSQPRMLAMWLARKHTRAALSEIGAYFGHRSHSTVVSAQKRVNEWMTQDSPVQLAERNWSIDDAIRQVERYLAAG
jgi:chromosomal replication initiator protein